MTSKRLIIDTDTAGDDVTSLLFGLLWPGVQLEAITTVAGNVPLNLCTRNALITVETAGRAGQVPVYPGCDRPILRPQIIADFVHGKDGMGNSFFPDPQLQPEKTHGANAIVSLINQYPGEIELVAHGPLTNVAVAYMLDPSIVNKVKHVWVMGGACNFRGNITPSAEFNFYADPDAAQMVFQAGFPLTMVGWEICTRFGTVSGDDLLELQAIDTPIAKFYHKVNAAALKFNLEHGGLAGITHPDSQTTAMCLNNRVLVESARYFVEIECQSEQRRGFSDVDTRFEVEPNEFWKGGEPNAEVCLKADYAEFFRMLKAMLKGDFSEFANA